MEYELPVLLLHRSNSIYPCLRSRVCYSCCNIQLAREERSPLKYTPEEIERLKERYKDDDVVLALLAHVVSLQEDKPPKRVSQFVPGGWADVTWEGHKND